MLLIQHLKVHWSKAYRGAPYSTVRSQMSKSVHLPKEFFDYNPLGYPSHYVYLEQTKTGLLEKINRIDTLTEFENIRSSAVEMTRKDDWYELRYRYDYHRALPERRKYNPEISMYVELNEIAMCLKPNEYGRITYNGRYTDFDTGEWGYNLDIINIINSPTEKTPLDIYILREPDKTYNQIAILY